MAGIPAGGTFKEGDLPLKGEKLDLISQQSIIFRDTSVSSNEYFNVVEFPNVLTSGKNVIKINAANGALVPSARIYVEIVAANGSIIFHNIPNYLEKDGTRVIVPHVTKPSQLGTATVYLASRTNIDPRNGRPIPYSRDPKSDRFIDIPNILWSRKITVAPEKENTSEIIYTQQPQITIQERITPYLQPINLTDVNIEKSGSGTSTIVIEPVPATNNAAVNTNLLLAEAAPAFQTVQQGALSMGTPNSAGLPAGLASAQVDNFSFQSSPAQNTTAVGNLGTFNNANTNAGANTSLNANQFFNLASAPAGSGTTQTSSPAIATIQGYSRMKVTGFPLSESMENNGLVIIKDPFITVAPGTILLDGKAATFTEIFAPNVGLNSSRITTTNTTTNVRISGSVVMRIIEVENTASALVSQQAGPGHVLGALGKFTYVPIVQNAPGGSGPGQAAIAIDQIEATLNFSSSHTEAFVTEITQQSQSFAEIVLGDIEPASGDVYKIKTLYKAGAGFGDFIDAGDTILERVEMLEDETRFEAIPAVGSVFNRMGHFQSQDDYDLYFVQSQSSDYVNIATENILTASFAPSALIGGITLTPNPDAFNATTNRFGFIHLSSSYEPTLTKGTQYNIRFDAHTRDTISGSNSSGFIPKPRIDVYVSSSLGPGIIVPVNQGDSSIPDRDIFLSQASLQTLQQSLTVDPNGTLAPDAQAGLLDNGPLGVRVGSYELNDNELSRGIAGFKFKSLKTAKAQVFFVVRRGQWTLARISMTTDADTGFTPNFTRMNVRIPKIFRDVPMSFRFRFFDVNGVQADMERTIFPMKFTMDNTVLTGDNNLVSGSLFLSNTINSGVEMAGVNSGFIRSVGYEGFTSASRTDKAGGFIMFSGSVLPDSPDSYNGVGLELVEHSESFLRFRSDPNGDGSVPGELDIRTNRFFLGSDASFISGSGDGTIAISSSNFELSTAGNIDMRGTITAEAGGTIGGFDINSDSLSSTNLFLSGSPAAGGGNLKKHMFISTSNFNVKENGDITASSFLMSGGTITDSVTILGSVTANSILTPATIDGNPATEANASSSISAQGFAKFQSASIAGFIVNTDEIRSGDSSLRLKSEGQITGSNIKVDGGQIGGFIINNDGLSGANIFISGSPATGGTHSSKNMFISSSNFNIKENGDVTGSEILLEAGQIGGFRINSDGISGTNIFISGSPATGGTHSTLNRFISTTNFNVKENGDVTGSALLMSGGKIAGFKFDDTSLFSVGDSSNMADPTNGSGIRIEADSTPAVFIQKGNSQNRIKLHFTGNSDFGITGTVSNNNIFELGSTNQIAGISFDKGKLFVTDIFHISSSLVLTDPIGFISSSAFKVSPRGAVTASSILLGDKAGNNFLQFADSTLTVQGSITANQIRTPATIDGNPSTQQNASSSIDENGFALFRSASIGGFVVNATAISASGLQLKSGGQITGSQVQFTGGDIGGWTITGDGLSSTGVHLSSSFGVNVFDTGNRYTNFVSLKYEANDNYGIIGQEGGNISFALGKNTISGEANNQIAGWEFDNEKLVGGNMIIRKDGTIESDGFASDVAGSGFRLTAAEGGFLEVENAKIRGTLATAVFEKETVNAVGGQLYVANSTTLTSSALHPAATYSITDTTMSVANVSGFTGSYLGDGEILSLKKITGTGFSTEYVLVQSASRNNPSSDTDFSGNIYVVRGYSGSVPGATGSLGDFASKAQTYSGSQVIVSTGRPGTGYVRINANPNDPTTPYIDIVERTGSAIYDIDLKARLGDLSGVTDNSFTDGVTGFGLYTQNGYFKGKIEVATEDFSTRPRTDYRIILAASGSDNSNHFDTMYQNIRFISSSHGYTNIFFNTSSRPSATPSDIIDYATGYDLHLVDNHFFGVESGNSVEGSQAGIKETLILNLFDEGKSVLSFADDNAQANVTGSAGSEWPVIKDSQGNETSGPMVMATGSGLPLNDPIAAGMSSSIAIASATVQSIRKLKHDIKGASTCFPLFVNNQAESSLTTGDYANIISGSNDVITNIQGFYCVNPRGGRWVHIHRSTFFALQSSTKIQDRILGFLLRKDIEQENYQAGVTKITGNMVQTGKIQSTNFATSVGSEFDLNNGTFKLGGSDDPKLEFDGSDLIVSGTIQALAGEIGGFEISDHAIAGANVFISGSALFSGAHAANNMFISTSKFNVKGNGDVTGSEIQLLGGQIGGFKLNSDGFTGAQIFISGSPEVSGVHSVLSMFISSSNFNVKGNGDVTGSEILLEGGQIGGMRIDAHGMHNINKSFFISGSPAAGGTHSSLNMFISSSNFNIKENGDVTGSEILLEAGQIGGFRINSDGISGTNIFISGSPATGGTHSSKNMFLSSSNFNIKENGDVTGSEILLEGGQIGGFRINTNGISGANIFISGSPATGGTHSSKNMFLSSSNFNIKENGDVTGSEILLEGGQIGGFRINTEGLSGTNIFISGSPATGGTHSSKNMFISSSNFNIKENGDVTGSQILLEGGRIASFTIDDDQIKSIPDAGGGYIQMLSDTTPNQRFLITPDGDLTGASGNFVMMFNYNSGEWGLRGTSAGNIIFQLGSTNKIAGFTFSDTKLSVGTTFAISSSTNNTDPVSFISSSAFKVSAGGNLTASNADFDGYAVARALRQKVVTITNSNKNEYFDTVDISTTSGVKTFARLRLDGAGTGNLADKPVAYVILNLNCQSTNNFHSSPAGDVHAIGDIIGPPAVAGGKSAFTIEIGEGKTVDFLHPDKISTTATNIGIGAFAQQISPNRFNYTGNNAT